MSGNKTLHHHTQVGESCHGSQTITATSVVASSHLTPYSADSLITVCGAHLCDRLKTSFKHQR